MRAWCFSQELVEETRSKTLLHNGFHQVLAMLVNGYHHINISRTTTYWPLNSSYSYRYLVIIYLQWFVTRKQTKKKTYWGYNKASDRVGFSFQWLPPEREQNMHAGNKNWREASGMQLHTGFQVAVTAAADPPIIHPTGRDNERCAQQDSTP